jgi:threonine aldolase
MIFFIVDIDGLPLPRSMSLTVAKLTPAISAKSICDIFSVSRRDFITSFSSIVYLNKLFGKYITYFIKKQAKSLFKSTFSLLGKIISD